nr:hypothetical protein BaRGS_013171 [Batillaria attramentaria]
MASLRFLVVLFLGALVLGALSQEVTSPDEGTDSSEEGASDNTSSAEDATGTEEMEEGDGSENEFKENICEDIEKALDEEESQGVAGSRRKRSAYGYGNHGGYVDYGRSYGDYYGKGYSGNYGTYGGYAGNRGGGYGGKQQGRLSYDQSYTKSPVLTFVKGFKPGKSYVEKGRVVRNYYRHGTYEVALQHYKFIPVIKVVPYTTYDTIGYTGHIQAHNDYTAVICKDCYHGYPKIDMVANKAPYNHLTRRFVYLPENYRIDGYKGGHWASGSAFGKK